MTIYCVICKKEPVFGQDSRSFHKFPNNENLKKKWMGALGLSSVIKHTKICSDHFDADSFHDTGQSTRVRRLLSTAVPRTITNTRVVFNIANETSTLGTQKENVQDTSLINNIKVDIDVPTQITQNNGQHCQEESNQSFLNETPELSTNFEVITDIGSKHYNIEKLSTEVLQENTVMTTSNIFDGNKCTATIDNKKSLKRSQLSIDISEIPPSKKFRFNDGLQTIHISREDFISDEAWTRLLKYTVYKNRQVEATYKKGQRKDKKIGNIKELIKSLREDHYTASADYLQVKRKK